jgi:hypothetical protein
MTDPQEWVRQQGTRTTALLAHATQVKTALEQTQATATSRDRSVTVTVGSAGILTGLQFSPRAEDLTLVQLTGRIMETYREACTKASANTMHMVEQLVGSESTILDLLRDSMPRTDNEPSSSGDHHG